MDHIISHEGREVIHDYRKINLQWGWNILGFDRINKKQAKIYCIGLGVKEGHYLATTQGNTDYVYEVTNIDYEINPQDYFTAILEIIGTLEIPQVI